MSRVWSVLNRREFLAKASKGIVVLSAGGILDTLAGGLSRGAGSNIGGLQQGSPWPKFHANNQNTGRGVGSGAVGRLKWKFKTGAWVSSSPAIGTDGVVYVGSLDSYVYALDGNTGRLKWKFLTGNEVSSSPAIGSDGVVYVGSLNGNVYALDGNTGRLKWKFQTGGMVMSSPAIGSDGTIYVGSRDRYVYAIK
ncbi:MAG: PQQ-binding-like beta-propeller repeat protein [Armatimonadetes bacterium]|nr:PQQ-binding-like beta-propeller repeat protein [Armatimonadota bacterium]